MLRSTAAVWVLVLCAAVSGCRKAPVEATAQIDPDRHYAVMLANGSVYFAKIQGFGSPYPVLTDVYYVQSGVNSQTKEPANVLVKRGKEWHSPDRMILSEKSIVFIEPVGPGSKVAQLISESKR